MESNKLKIISLSAMMIAITAAVLLATPRTGVTKLTNRSLESSSHRQQAEDLTQTIEALERRIQKLENMARITPKRGRVSTRNSENDRRNKGSEYSVKDLVAAKLDAAMALQHKFDKEAGMRTEKGRQAEGDVGTALRAVLDEEPLYSPLSAHEPECRKSMCRMQYRYSDPSIAEFAATSLLMELSGTFATTDLITLPNDDGSYELLVYANLK